MRKTRYDACHGTRVGRECDLITHTNKTLLQMRLGQRRLREGVAGCMHTRSGYPKHPEERG